MILVDWTRLAALREDIGEGCFAEIATMFVDEIQETLNRLTAAPDTATAADFHFLRGSAANMGLVEMALACERAEAECTAGRPADLGAVDGSFRRSLAELGQTLPALAAAA